MKLEIKPGAEHYIKSVDVFGTKTPMIRILAKSEELAFEMDRALCTSCEAYKLEGFFCSAMMTDEMAIMCDTTQVVPLESPIVSEVIAKSNCIEVAKTN
jgi:hypothetical protein